MKNYKRLTRKKSNGRWGIAENLDVIYLSSDRIANRLCDLEDKIESGTLFELPCKIGDTIYVIPSESNFKLNKLERLDKNNKVYKQKVFGFVILPKDFLVSICDGDECKAGKAYGETWFLTEEEAQKKLGELENDCRKSI